jgi:hypothetical protein
MKSELSEEAMRFLEEKIPELADAAFKQAYLNALASGDSVLICDDETIYEVFPDGTRKFVKKLESITPD